MKLFDLYATLGLDSSSFTSGLSSAGRSFSSFSSSVSSGIGGVSGSVSSFLKKTASAAISLEQTVEKSVTRATTAFAGLFSGLTVTGVKYNSMMEDYQMDFTTLLQDADKAAEKVEELRKLDLSSPLDMTSLASATKLMLSFSLSEEEVGEKLLQLGDISMGSAERLNSMALAYSQIRSVGKLTMIDLRQMANQGFNPLKTVAEQTGVAIGDLQDFMSYGKPSEDMVASIKMAQEEVERLGDSASVGSKMLAQMAEDGYISADIVSEAITIATSKGGQFYKASENAAKTLTGQFSILQGGIKKLVGSGFEPLSEALTDSILPNLNAFVDELDVAFNTQNGGSSGLTAMLAVARDELYKLREESDEYTKSAQSGIIKGSFLFANTVKTFNGILPTFVEVGDDLFDSLRDGFELAVPRLAKSAELLAPSVISGIINVKGDFFDAGLEIVTGIAKGIVKDYSPDGERKIHSAITGLFAQVDEWVSDEENTYAMGQAAANILGSLSTAMIEKGPGILLKTIKGIWAGFKEGVWGEEKTPEQLSGELDSLSKNENYLVNALTSGEYDADATHSLLQIELNRLEKIMDDAWTLSKDEEYERASVQMSALSALLDSGLLTNEQAAIVAAERIASGEVTLDDVLNDWAMLESEIKEVNDELETTISYLDDLDGKSVHVSMFLGTSDGTTLVLGKTLLSDTHYIAGHETGLDFVPYDNYMARLHHGEAVLTAQQAKKWRRDEQDVDVMVVQQEESRMRPIVINVDGKTLVAAIGEEMNKSIGNANIEQILAMGGV